MVLAAGSATGLYPLTYTLPVALVPILNRPAIEQQLDWLAQAGVEEVVVNLHYLHRAVSEALQKRQQGDKPRLHLTVEAELSGTAGGVALAQDHFRETFCVVGVDCVTNLDLRPVLEHHRSRRALCTIVAQPSQGASRFGHMELGEGDRVVKFVEKPSSRQEGLAWISTGIYLLEPEIFDHIPDVRPFDFGQHLFPELVGPRGGVFAYRAQDIYWQDFGEPLAYRQVHRDLLNGVCHLPNETPLGESGVSKGDGCVVDAKAEVVGPVVLGRNVVLRAGCRIVGPTVLGDDVVVGENASVTDSVIWARTVVEPGATVSSSLVGSSCHLYHDRVYNGVLLASGARFEKKAISSD
jgi:mannose-1-phosphate guanylyltransferase/phosphomannomutase